MIEPVSASNSNKDIAEETQNVAEDVVNDGSGETEKDGAEETEKDVTEESVKNGAEEIEKDVAEETVKDGAEKMEKDVAEEIVKDGAEKKEKDVAEETTVKDGAEEIEMDVAEETVKDIAEKIVKDRAEEDENDGFRKTEKDCAEKSEKDGVEESSAHSLDEENGASELGEKLNEHDQAVVTLDQSPAADRHDPAEQEDCLDIEKVSSAEKDNVNKNFPAFIEKAYIIEWDPSKDPNSDSLPYRCQKCGSELADFVTLIQHVKGHITHPMIEPQTDVDGEQKYERIEATVIKIRTSNTPVIPEGFSCSLCSKTFDTKQELAEHKPSHVPKKQFRCTACRRHFWTEQELSGHVALHDPANHYCQDCGKKFVSAEHLQKHVQAHELQNSLYQCEDCELSFYGLSMLKRHFATKHEGIKIYSCQICARIHTDRAALSEHIRDVHPGLRVKCGICTKRFSDPQQAATHARRVHIQSAAHQRCTLCTKTHPRRPWHAQHLWRHTASSPYQCRLCDGFFDDEDAVAAHLILKHTITCDGRSGNEGAGRADDDGSPTRQSTEFDKENIVDTMMVYGTMDESLKDAPRCFECYVCGHRLGSKLQVRAHVSQVHSRVKRFACSYCNCRFLKQETLDIHLEKRHPPGSAVWTALGFSASETCVPAKLASMEDVQEVASDSRQMDVDGGNHFGVDLNRDMRTDMNAFHHTAALGGATTSFSSIELQQQSVADSLFSTPPTFYATSAGSEFMPGVSAAESGFASAFGLLQGTSAASGYPFPAQNVGMTASNISNVPITPSFGGNMMGATTSYGYGTLPMQDYSGMVPQMVSSGFLEPQVPFILPHTQSTELVPSILSDARDFMAPQNNAFAQPATSNQEILSGSGLAHGSLETPQISNSSLYTSYDNATGSVPTASSDVGIEGSVPEPTESVGNNDGVEGSSDYVPPIESYPPLSISEPFVSGVGVKATISSGTTPSSDLNTPDVARLPFGLGLMGPPVFLDNEPKPIDAPEPLQEPESTIVDPLGEFMETDEVNEEISLDLKTPVNDVIEEEENDDASASLDLQEPTPEDKPEAMEITDAEPEEIQKSSDEHNQNKTENQAFDLSFQTGTSREDEPIELSLDTAAVDASQSEVSTVEITEIPADHSSQSASVLDAALFSVEPLDQSESSSVAIIEAGNEGVSQTESTLDASLASVQPIGQSESVSVDIMEPVPRVPSQSQGAKSEELSLLVKPNGDSQFNDKSATPPPTSSELSIEDQATVELLELQQAAQQIDEQQNEQQLQDAQTMGGTSGSGSDGPANGTGGNGSFWG